jgi:hypothetical protein
MFVFKYNDIPCPLDKIDKVNRKRIESFHCGIRQSVLNVQFQALLIPRGFRLEALDNLALDLMEDK